MIMSIYVILIGLMGIIAQMLFPSWSIFFEMEPHLPALAVIYGCFMLRGQWVFLVTAFIGLGMDLLSPQKMGLSVLSLTITTLLMLTQRRTLSAERWETRLLLIIAGTYFYQMIDYLLYSIQMQRWMWPSSLWYRMLFPAFFNAAISLILFPVATRFAVIWGWYEPRHFTEEYART
jgi:rod shape-determining protein MreD